MRRERRAANVRKMKQAIPNVEVRVDELILHGFPAGDRYIIGDALMSELGQLLDHREPNIFPAKDTHIPVLNAGRILLPSNVKPVSVGAQIAQAVYGSLNHSNGGNQR